jgi:hypothetical protein
LWRDRFGCRHSREDFEIEGLAVLPLLWHSDSVLEGADL